ncbi:hypothetical protein C8R42DRAFT_159809 [Lentinula raphanica]|nr:hypothetical protein C8R42DRAFT_159809 [Lentinula raphanica]
MLPNHFLAFLSTIGVALTAVAVPLPHATTHGESAQDDSGLGAPRALVNVYERAKSAECSLDPSVLPSTLPSTPNDGLWAENVSPSPLCCDPSVDSRCPPRPSAPVARAVTVEARTGADEGKEVKHSVRAASVPSPPVVVGSYGRTILMYLSGQTLNPGNVYDLLKSIDPGQWAKDVRNSKTLANFKKTDSGGLYLDTDKLLGESHPKLDRVELESMILKELFTSVKLRRNRKIRYPSLTKYAYLRLQELRTYVEDTRKSEDFQAFKSTHSGRLLQVLYEAIRDYTSRPPGQPVFRIDNLEFWVDQDIRGITTPEDKASDGLRWVLGEDWDAKQRVCTKPNEYLFPKETRQGLDQLNASAPREVAVELAKLYHVDAKECGSAEREHHHRGPPGQTGSPHAETPPSL